MWADNLREESLSREDVLSLLSGGAHVSAWCKRLVVRPKKNQSGGERKTAVSRKDAEAAKVKQGPQKRTAQFQCCECAGRRD